MEIEKSLELDVILEQVKQYCATPMGIAGIEKIRPVYDRLLIRRNHGLMKEALDAVIRFGSAPFDGIRDDRNALQNASKNRILLPVELLREIKLIRGIRALKNYEKTIESDHERLRELFDSLIVHDSVERELSRCINDYGEVTDQASPALAGIRSSLRHIDGEITDAVHRFIASHSSSMMDTIVTYRNGRAVVLVKAGEKNAFGGIVYGDSASGQASYIEPAAIVSVNNRKQELLGREQEEVDRILADCSSLVSKIAMEEMDNLFTCGILDEVFAKAEWGKVHHAAAASLSNKKEFDLKGAWHPLIPEENAVRNHYRLMEPHETLMITGPNTGGKTVSLKIIGLFALMTYAGIPVTADEAVIPYYDRIFADIGDDQSVVSSLSSFSSSIRKISEILADATEHSLVLLDEIGSGTDPREGESLAIAVLNELRRRRATVIVTTHYSRLKTYGKKHEDILLASVQFDMERLIPTYRYLEGITGQSNALEVAARYGMPKEILSYARFLKNQAKSEEDELLEKLERQLNENQLIQENLLQQKKETEEEKKKTDRLLRQLEADKERLKDEARQEAERIKEEAQTEADRILKEMRLVRESGKIHEAIEARHRLMTEVAPVAETGDDSAYSYQAGEAVELRSTGQVAEILSINRKDMTILLNGRELRVKKKAVRPTLKRPAKIRPEQTVHVYVSKPVESVPLECNLIGMHADEAAERTRRYLDQAKVSGLRFFRIIHGDGTGALRKAVHKILAADSSVKEFRLGMPEEGGTGATVVVLKE